MHLTAWVRATLAWYFVLGGVLAYLELWVCYWVLFVIVGVWPLFRYALYRYRVYQVAAEVNAFVAAFEAATVVEPAVSIVAESLCDCELRAFKRHRGA